MPPLPAGMPFGTKETFARARSFSNEMDPTFTSIAFISSPIVGARCFRYSTTPAFTASGLSMFLEQPARTKAVTASAYLFTDPIIPSLLQQRRDAVRIVRHNHRLVTERRANLRS